MEVPILKDLIIILGLAFLVILFSNRLRVPAIIGFLLTGLIAGPHALSLIQNIQEVKILAEIGIILLLFTIGIEFSLGNFLKIRRSVLLGGSLQVTLTLGVVAGIAYSLGMDINRAVFLGFIVALSSTAVVLKILNQRVEIDTPHGRTSLGILIFQDIIIVPMILLTPLLGGRSENFLQSLIVILAKGAGVIGLALLLARWLVPKLLFQAARLKDRELFLMAVVLIGFGVAWLTHQVGLSAALGAFLAGLIISESEYSHRALGNIIPFRDIFTCLFFVSVGMLLDLGFFLERPGTILLLALSVLVLKTLTGGLSVMILGYPLRTSVLVGFALCQIGEFSFILSESGIVMGLLDHDSYQLFLGVCILTMIATPFTISSGPRVSELLSLITLPNKIKEGSFHELAPKVDNGLRDHLIIVGFGNNGKNLAKAANASQIPYTIIELNPETVRKQRAAGLPMYYGDATQEAVLEHAGIERARVLVIAITDAPATRRIVEAARRLSPKVHIIARTLFVVEMEPLYKLGADEVVPQEFETSVEIFTRVLTKYLAPWDEIVNFTNEVRAEGYRVFRSPVRESATIRDLMLHVPGFELNTFRVHESSPANGKSPLELELRKKYEVTLLAIRRGAQTLPHPSAEERLRAGDIIVLFGKPEKISAVSELFSSRDMT